jgi:hypothetical protein
MAPILTPEERYDRLINEAWWRFQAGDRGRMAAIERLLERASNDLAAEILRASGPDGRVKRQHMLGIQARLARPCTNSPRTIPTRLTA